MLDDVSFIDRMGLLRVFVAQQSGGCPVFRTVRKQVGTMEVPVVLRKVAMWQQGELEWFQHFGIRVWIHLLFEEKNAKLLAVD